MKTKNVSQQFRRKLPAIEGGVRNILVVDDSATSRAQAKMALSSSTKYCVQMACDGRQALEMLGRDLFDVVLLDQRMPDMEGHEMCRELHRLQKNPPPVIMVSAVREKAVLQQCLDAGAADVIVKPYSLQMLRQHVDAAYNLRFLSLVSE